MGAPVGGRLDCGETPLLPIIEVDFYLDYLYISIRNIIMQPTAGATDSAAVCLGTASPTN